MIVFSLTRKYSGYEQKYKEQVITEFLNIILPGFKYEPDIDLEKENQLIEQYKKAELDLKYFNKWHCEDFITGETEGLKLNIYELVTEHQYIDDNNNKRNAVMFSGLCTDFKLEFDKNIDIKILNKQNNADEERKTVELDNKEFNDKFIVVANSDIEVYQILTSEVILFLNTHIENIKFDISIKNNMMFMRFYTKPVFEAGFNDVIMKKESFYRYYEVLNFIIAFSNKINSIYNYTNI